MDMNFDCARRAFRLPTEAAGRTESARTEAYPSRLVTTPSPTSPGSGGRYFSVV